MIINETLPTNDVLIVASLYGLKICNFLLNSHLRKTSKKGNKRIRIHIMFKLYMKIK